MSVLNPFSDMSGWRVDPDRRQDRKSSEVVSYKLTPQELDKLLNEKGGNDMPRTKITREQLLQECRVHGADKNARQIISKKYDMSAHSVECAISKYKIVDALQRSSAKVEAAPKKEIPTEPKKEVPAEPKKPFVNPEFDKLFEDFSPKVNAAGEALEDVRDKFVIGLSPNVGLVDKVNAVVSENKRLKQELTETKAVIEKAMRILEELH